MKKVISLILSIIMLMSAAALPTWAAASAVTPKTYIAKQNFKNKDGQVSGRYFEFNTSEKIMFDNSGLGKDDLGFDELDFNLISTYVRGNEIYYVIDGYDYNSSQYKYYFKSSDITVLRGKGSKVLYESTDRMYVIGGYGQSIFFKEGKQVKKYYKGKISNVF
ncbi:MAG: hypothetical protein ACI4GY_01840, partial [Acutalibacteraceae bacterium]